MLNIADADDRFASIEAMAVFVREDAAVDTDAFVGVDAAAPLLGALHHVVGEGGWRDEFSTCAAGERRIGTPDAGDFSLNVSQFVVLEARHVLECVGAGAGVLQGELVEVRWQVLGDHGLQFCRDCNERGLLAGKLSCWCCHCCVDLVTRTGGC